MSDAAGPKGGAGRGNSYSNLREAELAIRWVLCDLTMSFEAKRPKCRTFISGCTQSRSSQTCIQTMES
jgi:hypothetical protein